MIEDRLSDAMEACREAVAPSPDFFDRMEERGRRAERRRRVRLVIASAAAAALIFAGAVVLTRYRDRSGAASSTRRDFVTHANGICARAIRQVQAGSPAGSPSTDELAAGAERTSLIDQSAITALRSVAVPAPEAAAVRAMLNEFDQALGAANVYHAVKYANGGPTSPTPQSRAALDTASNAIAEAVRLAHNDAIDRCADMIHASL